MTELRQRAGILTGACRTQPGRPARQLAKVDRDDASQQPIRGGAEASVERAEVQLRGSVACRGAGNAGRIKAGFPRVRLVEHRSEIRRAGGLCNNGVESRRADARALARDGARRNGNEEGPRIELLPTDAAGGLQPVHDRHADIQQDDVVAPCVKGAQHLFPVGDDVGRVAQLLELRLLHHAVGLVIVGQQQCQRFDAGHCRPTVLSLAGNIGNSQACAGRGGHGANSAATGSLAAAGATSSNSMLRRSTLSGFG